MPKLKVLRGGSAGKTIHTLLFVSLGFGTILAYGFGTISYSLPKWLALCAAGLIVLCGGAAVLLRTRRIVIDRTDLAVAAVSAYAVLSLAWTPDPAGGLSQLCAYLTLAALFLYARHSDPARLEYRMALVAVCCVALFLLRGLLTPGIEGGFGNANYFAETLLLLVPFAALWTFRRTGPDRWIGVALALGAAAFLVTSNASRIEYLAAAFLAAAAAGTVLLQGRAPAVAASVIAAALAFASAAVWLFGDMLAAAGPIRDRFEIFVNSAMLWTSAPVFGHGIGGFDYAYPAVQQEHLRLFPPDAYPSIAGTALGHPFAFADAAHNEFLQVLTEFGLVGFALCAVPFAAAVRGALDRRTRTPLRLAAAAAFAFLAADMLVNFPLRLPATAALGAVAMGILARREPGAARPLALTVPRPAAFAAVLGAAGVSVAGAYGIVALHQASHAFARSEAYRGKDPYSAFRHVLTAEQRFPLSVRYRRQLFVSYVDWVAAARDRTVPLSRDSDRLYRTGLSTGPDNPGLLITRIRFLLLAGRGETSRPEIEGILDRLKRIAPYFADIHTAEAAFAKWSGDAKRAAEASGRASQLRRRFAE